MKMDRDLEINYVNTDGYISYPCYKNFDPFIDIDRLTSLDEILTKEIQNHIQNEREDYFLNAFRLDEKNPHQPGAREIWLTRPATEENIDAAYDQLNQPNLWRLSKNAERFKPLMDFISTMPFKSTGRILIIYDDAQTSVPAHRDHLDINLCHEFIWCRTNLKKPFYMLNHETNRKCYVDSYSAWFDSVNQFHGTDGAPGLSFSIRVDGQFTDEFRKQIPYASHNLAATPALWSTIENRSYGKRRNQID